MGGLLSRVKRLCRGEKRIKTLVLGLPDAGKTTILYILLWPFSASGDPFNALRFDQWSAEVAMTDRFSFASWHAGTPQAAICARHHNQGVEALVFVVDSSDRGLLQQASEELHLLLREVYLQEAVLLVLAHKQDAFAAMSTLEVTEGLRLDQVDRKWFVQGTSKEDYGSIYAAFDWLYGAVVTKRREW